MKQLRRSDMTKEQLAEVWSEVYQVEQGFLKQCDNVHLLTRRRCIRGAGHEPPHLGGPEVTP